MPATRTGPARVIYGTCEKCHEVVESPQTPAFPITGYEVPRDQGGANHIRNRKRVPGVVRHLHCLDDDQQGVQESLL